MAVGTGTVSMSDIRTEWGRSGTISMSEMYRGGSHVLAKASDNTATNDAASVPTTGAISVDDFRGTSKGFTKTYTATATNQNASTIFGDDYDLNYPKNIVINSGVEIGATSSTDEALEIPSGAVGTITITNNGTITGAGGAAGADGGDAFEAASNCILINNGTIRAGGGGGGTGGSGQFQSSTTQLGQGYGLSWSTCYISCTQRYGGNAFCSGQCASYEGQVQCLTCSRYNYTATSGGSGGVGAGYGQSAGTGVAGGTNAGTGGNGGSFGASATAGANGNTGNGTSGGVGGNYIRGNSFVTLTNNGTLTGSVV